MSGSWRFLAPLAAFASALVACYSPRLVDCTVRCGDDGSCHRGMQCSNGFCTAGRRCAPQETVATDAPKPAEPCEPGETRCGGVERVERCDDAGAAWLSLERCADDAPICQSRSCVACAAGAIRCASAGAFQRCAASNVWNNETTTCPGDAPRCAAGACVPGLTVSAGGAFACARLEDGAIECWGANDSGQLAAGDRVERGSAAEPAFVRVALGAAATQVSAGGAHACALLESGVLKCWGANGRGQLGLGNVEARGADPSQLGDALPRVDLGSGALPVAVAAGDRHTCVLLDRGQIKCFGANEYGQLGVGDTEARGDDADEMGDALVAVDLGPGAAAIAVRAGQNHSCALLTTGEVKCWGANEYGQLGVGDELARGDEPGELGAGLIAVALSANGLRAVDLSAGANHTCALLEDGAVVCWGINGQGQLGAGDKVGRGTSAPTPRVALVTVDLASTSGAVQISVGAHHSCALTRDRGVLCWGANVSGALGVGDRRWRGDEAGDLGGQLAAVPFGEAEGAPLRALFVSAGLDFNCVTLNDGAIKCWGENRHGQLGIGDTEARGDEPAELGAALPNVALD